MKAPRKTIGAVIALTLVAVLSVVLLRPREPHYKGRPLTAWLEDWDRSFGPPGTLTIYRAEQGAEVENALRQMGSQAVPSLRRMLRARDSRLRVKVVAFCAKRPWIPIRFRAPAEKLHRRALFGIRTLGPVGKPAVPELIELLTDPSAPTRAYAAFALSQVGPEANIAIPELIKRLTDEDGNVRAATCRTLRQAGPSAREALPGLIRCLRDTNDTVFSAALGAVLQIGAVPSDVVPPVDGAIGPERP
jgi:HEAT repeats